MLQVKLDMGHVLAKMTKLERLVLRQLLINEEGIREETLSCGLADFFKAYLKPKAGAPGLCPSRRPLAQVSFAAESRFC